MVLASPRGRVTRERIFLNIDLVVVRNQQNNVYMFAEMSFARRVALVARVSLLDVPSREFGVNGGGRVRDGLLQFCPRALDLTPRWQPRIGCGGPRRCQDTRPDTLSQAGHVLQDRELQPVLTRCLDQVKRRVRRM